MGVDAILWIVTLQRKRNELGTNDEINLSCLGK